MKKILITGANSYLGTRFSEYMSQWPEHYRVDTLDLLEGDWREKSFRGYDCVYHVAGIAHIRETKENAHLYYEIDRDLAVEVAQKAKAEGVGQYIFPSSMSVYGMSVGVITADTKPTPRTNYGLAKLEAEYELYQLRSKDFRVAIMRPPMVYGEGCKGNYQALVKIAKLTPVFPDYRNQRSMLHVDGLCACVKDLIDEQADGLFIPQNKEYVCTSKMVREVARDMGKKVRLWKILNPAIRFLARYTMLGEKAFGNLYYDLQSGEQREGYQVCKLEYRAALPKGVRHGIDVVIVNCFETLEHRVELLRRYFMKKGKRVHVITSDWEHFHKRTRSNCPEGYEMIHVRPYNKNLSVDRLMSHHYFAQEVRERLEEIRPKLIWTFVPPNSLAECTAIYKENHPKVKLVMDLMDMWPETMPISGFKTLPPFSCWKNLRDECVGHADAVVTECNLFQKPLEGKCPPEKMHTLYLARDWTDVSGAVNLPANRIALCYLGSINNIIDIACIEKIIRSIGTGVDLHIIGDGEKRKALIDTATKAGANVIFYGKVYDRGEKQKIMDQCHAGLNIMKKSVFVGLTMKSMDYFECGIPIINNIKGDTWQFVDEYGIGINITEDVTISAEQIQRLQKNRKQVHEFGKARFDVAVFNENLDRITSAL